MTRISYTALTTEIAQRLRAGGPDANGQIPERSISDGDAKPCRHCLRQIPAGAEMLILAHRPFPALQPYAETGPIFLCADPCQRHDGTEVPEIGQTSPDYLLKGYDDTDRIKYGTGAVVPAAKIAARAGELLDDPDIAYVHVRSSRNNCYQFRIDRG